VQKKLSSLGNLAPTMELGRKSRLEQRSTMMLHHATFLCLLLLPDNAAADLDYNDEGYRRQLKLQHLAGFIPMTQIADQVSRP
jgi:hypothetical protein